MAYAILRTAKLKTYGNISGSAKHNFRERVATNSDDRRMPMNQTKGAQSAAELQTVIKERLKDVRVRKNAVLAIEYLITASPEWFDDHGSHSKTEDYFAKAETWLREKHGSHNVLAVTRHNDKKTPYICAYVLPIDPKGKLNASHFLDGRAKLSQMQTDFAQQCGQALGLLRGIEGSKATHTTIKQYHANIQHSDRTA